MTEDIATAYHESGHAIAHIHFGCRIKSIEIGDNGAGLTRILEPLSRPLSSLQTAICCCAGPASELRFTGSINYHNQETDLRQARALVGEAGLARALQQAGLLVLQYEGMIATITWALIVHGRLTEDQLMAILEGQAGSPRAGAARPRPKSITMRF
jgi:hypothetical protein